MILPGSYLFTVLLLVLGLIGWGLWAGTFKLAGKWRYELYYFDFAIGMAIAATVVALTFGSMGWDGFSFLDDLRNAGKRQDFFAFMAGCVLNLGNVLLLAAISVSGMSVGLPIGLGIALVTGAVWSSFTHPGANPAFVAAGCVAVVAGVVLNAIGYRSYAAQMKMQQAASISGGKGKARKESGFKPIVLGAGAGLLLGSFMPLVELAADTENGLGPYGISFLMSAAVVATTFIFSLFMMNLPVQGQPTDFGQYFKGNARQHGLGVLGGVMFAVATVASLIAGRVEGAAHVGSALSFTLANGAPVLGGICGMLVFKEFSDGDSNVKTFLYLTLLLLASGIALLALAPQFGSRA